MLTFFEEPCFEYPYKRFAYKNSQGGKVEVRNFLSSLLYYGRFSGRVIDRFSDQVELTSVYSKTLKTLQLNISLENHTSFTYEKLSSPKWDSRKDVFINDIYSYCYHKWRDWGLEQDKKVVDNFGFVIEDGKAFDYVYTFPNCVIALVCHYNRFIVNLFWGKFLIRFTGPSLEKLNYTVNVLDTFDIDTPNCFYHYVLSLADDGENGFVYFKEYPNFGIRLLTRTLHYYSIIPFVFLLFCLNRRGIHFNDEMKELVFQSLTGSSLSLRLTPYDQNGHVKEFKNEINFDSGDLDASFVVRLGSALFDSHQLEDLIDSLKFN